MGVLRRECVQEAGKTEVRIYGESAATLRNGNGGRGSSVNTLESGAHLKFCKGDPFGDGNGFS